MKRLVLMLACVVSVSAQASEIYKPSPGEVARNFYSAFSRLDFEMMNAMYADNRPDAFMDPVFGKLSTDEARSMWKMLVLSSKAYSQKMGIEPLQISYQLVKHDESVAVVKWTARYTYSETGREIENHITTHLVVKDGKIVEQFDSFDLCKWTAMAFEGLKANSCRVPVLINKTSQKKLKKFMETESQPQPK